MGLFQSIVSIFQEGKDFFLVTFDYIPDIKTGLSPSCSLFCSRLSSQSDSSSQQSAVRMTFQRSTGDDDWLLLSYREDNRELVYRKYLPESSILAAARESSTAWMSEEAKSMAESESTLSITRKRAGHVTHPHPKLTAFLFLTSNSSSSSTVASRTLFIVIVTSILSLKTLLLP